TTSTANNTFDDALLPTISASNTANVSGVLTEDVNADGRMDIVFALSQAGGGLQWSVAYQAPRPPNSTGPSFSAPQVLGLPLQQDTTATGPNFVDLDGDGTPEVIAEGSVGHRDFYVRTSTGYVARGVTGLDGRELIGDFNGDGRPDVLVPYT